MPLKPSRMMWVEISLRMTAIINFKMSTFLNNKHRPSIDHWIHSDDLQRSWTFHAFWGQTWDAPGTVRSIRRGNCGRASIRTRQSHVKTGDEMVIKKWNNVNLCYQCDTSWCKKFIDTSCFARLVVQMCSSDYLRELRSGLRKPGRSVKTWPQWVN